ncbi:MAG: PIN domain protein [Nitrospirae bacterium]|nr:PIN domain protein [Nitrospirota bacterium]
MRKLKLYLDTSVIGGYFDEEFSCWSQKIIADFRKGNLRFYLSTITEAEIVDAPNEVKELFYELLELGAVVIQENEDSLNLADKYIDENILSINYRDDARHIAIATVSDIDVLVSWNFKHIVHYDKIKKFNSVNIKEGYKPIDIYSPMEVASE